ncbi:kelch domain containing 2, isoform CRA_g [Rattus norvegicus]|uniref:Kelch domain containing 2, isoform CRA_g n=1 Tax=Rattus norvegicus TaxID=10116 RepID=A6HBW0_RAT|nr:kelch domain containing 2, isoform CRA_g [Rattus norvegicus]
MATRMLERRTCQARPSKATRPWSWPARPSAAATSPSAMGATCSSGAATRKKINTEGDVPPSMSGSCAVCVDRVLYLFGGHHSRGNTNKGKAPSPRAAHACATVGNKGFVFGGRYRVMPGLTASVKMNGFSLIILMLKNQDYGIQLVRAMREK